MTISLNDEQCVAILTEGLNKKAYESPGNAVPTDPAQRQRDATELVEAVMAASKAGNKSEFVKSVLFIAQCDMKPLVAEETTPAPVPAVAESSQSESTVDGLDLTTLADGILDQLIVGLDKYPQTEQVENDRKLYLAEKERRAGGPQAIQEIAPAAAQGAAAESAGEISAEGPAAESNVGAEEASGGGEPNAEAEGMGGGVAAADSAQAEDAGAFARAQTSETSPEGKQAKAKSPESDDQRTKIESELTLPMVKAHGIDILKLGEVPLEQLEYMIANPKGPPKEDQMAISEVEVEANAIPSNLKGVSLGGIVANTPQDAVVSKADLGLSNVTDDSDDSGERDKLEGMLKGTTLKAYGRGRKEVPSIGINELKFMILNDDGKITQEELSAARAKDNLAKPLSTEVVTLPSGDTVNIATSTTAESAPEEKAKIIIPEEETSQDRTIAQAAVEAVAKAPPVEQVPVETTVSAPTQVITKSGTEAIVNSDEVIPGDNIVSSGNRAMEIINKENFPIAPELNGEIPVLPFDLSKCSRDELFSYHARFHASEARMNWILCQEEDTLGDIEKLRTNREAIVAANVPFMGEDGKRNTNEFRDSQVAADKEVLELGMKEHEINKTVKRLKVLQRNYMKDCERLSRQMSKYERERLDVPR